MKKTIIIYFLLLIAAQSIACDICGGGLGANYSGLLPNFNKKFIGIRYHFNQMNTQLNINGEITALSNYEKYNTLELWSAWNIGQKWRLMTILPYSFIDKHNIGTNLTNAKNGLGDISINGYYNLLNQSKEDLINQSIWVGLGTKLPTGKYNNTEFNSNNSANIYQLGTGSFDFLGSINYDIRYKSIGINAGIIYKINTENKDDYRYGNKLTANANIYYHTQLPYQINIRPHIGLQYENQAKDQTIQYKLEETGGENTNLILGIETNFKMMAIGTNYQIPIKQNINNHRTEINKKLSAHITYTF